MSATTPRRLLIFAATLTGIAALVLHYKERNSYSCQLCSSQKDVFQWRVGWWMGASVPLTPRWERVRESHFLHDFFPTGHAHDWKFAQGSPYHFFGTSWSGCALGAGRHQSELCQMYELSPEFRSFIQTKLRDGSLTRSNFVALASAPHVKEPSTLQKEADELLAAFYRK